MIWIITFLEGQSMKNHKTNKVSSKDEKKSGLFDFLKRVKGEKPWAKLEFNLDLIRSIKIQWRLIIVFLLLSIGPLIVLGLSSYSSSRKALTDNIQHYTKQVLTQFGSNVSNEVKKSIEVLDSIILSSLIQENFDGAKQRSATEEVTLREKIVKEMSANITIDDILYWVLPSDRQCGYILRYPNLEFPMMN